MFKNLYSLFFIALFFFSFNTLFAQATDSYDGPVEDITLHQESISFEGGEDVLWDNGPIITLPGGGCAGGDASVLETTVGGHTLYGWNVNKTAYYYMADDFTSTAEWNIDSIKFFAYQTSATTLTITGVYVQIWNGAPNAGGTVIWGDTTTNRLSFASLSNIYRSIDTDVTNCARRVQEVVAFIGTNLPPGQYWLQWGITGSAASGPWQPPVTIPGQAVTGDALQKTPTGWQAALNGTTSPNGAPFIVYGTSGIPCPVEPATNPSPANGATDVPISGNTATWTNGSGATAVEVWFGPVGNLVQVYDGVPITSFSLAPVEPLNYFTDYAWRVVNKNDTCAGGPVATWTFKTENIPGLNILAANPGPSNNGGSANWAMFFDLIADPDYTVEVFQMTTASAAGAGVNFNIEFFVRTGTALGGPVGSGPGSSSAGWTSLGSVPVTQGSTASGVSLPFSTPAIVINPGDTVGVAMQFLGVGPRYFGSGTNPYGIYSNTHLTLITGDVRSAPFTTGGSFFSSRELVGELYYNATIIPVELTSFTASVSDTRVTLNWSTATETNNQGFTVERSNGNEFAAVGFVNGKGTTTEVQNYSFVDAGVTPGSYSYRLKQVDFDGTFEYSNTIEVEVLAPKEFALNQNFPNPFNPSTMITFSLAVDAKVSLKVFDILGQEVMTIVNNNLSAGAHEYTFDASNFNSGVYFYRIEATAVDGQNFTSVKKMILTK
jgi:hypothetical protein